MRKTIMFVLLALIATSGLWAQEKIGFFQRQMGKGVSADPLQLSFDVYPFLFLGQGGGGSIGLEFSHLQMGAIGFGVVPPEFIKTNFFRDADDIMIRRNYAAELFVNYFPRKDRKGIYAGILGGPEWFYMEDNLTGARETIIKSYIVSRIGLRVFPFKRTFYADASFGYSFNLSGTEARTLGQTTYRASSGGMIYFLQLGARFDLIKN